MNVGKPGVRRSKAGFGAKSDKRKDKDKLSDVGTQIFSVCHYARPQHRSLAVFYLRKGRRVKKHGRIKRER